MIPLPEITIKGFPMPPSMNNLYANRPNGGRFKTLGYKSFEQTVQWWCTQNAHQVDRLRDWVLHLPEKHGIRVDHIFHFLPHKIITKAGKPRKNDTWNRPKALHDVICEYLSIDDSFFWSGSVEKSPIIIEGLQESVDLHFSFVDLRKSKRFSEDDQ